MIGSDFKAETVDRRTKCGECGKALRPGDASLVSRRLGRIRKRVCSEACRLRFDDRYWRGRAYERVHGAQDRFYAGNRVRVGPAKPDGTPHPHAGKTGVILEIMGLFLELQRPRAQVRIDPGFPDAGNIMVVSLSCLERL